MKNFRKYAVCTVVLLLSTGVLCLSKEAAAEGVIELPQTGQTTCYDRNGSITHCSNTGQDGAWQAGVPWPDSRFVSGTGAESECMIDELTGLMWPKYGNLPNGRRTWQGALNFANGLDFCGYTDWRLPNVIELKSLVNSEERDTAAWLSDQGFYSVQSSYSYWSSSTRSDYTGGAWSVSMRHGGVGGGSKGSSFYVWPVRAGQTGLGDSAVDLPRTGQTACYDLSGNVKDCAGTGQDGELQMGAAWPDDRFVSGTGVESECMIDELTGLMWTKDGNLSGAPTWQQALNSANGLDLCGYTDWRLPNIVELRSLVNAGEPSTAAWLNSQGFNSVQSRYWSSSTNAYASLYAWIVHMNGGSMSSYDKDWGNDTEPPPQVWPVRAGQYGSFGNSDISISLTDSPDPVGQGVALTYVASITNNGPDAATHVLFTDRFPSGAVFVSVNPTQGTCSHSSGSVSCVVGDLGSGTSVTVTIVVKAPAVAGTIINSAEVSCTSNDPNGTNNVASVTTTMTNRKPTILTISPSTLTSSAGEARTFSAIYKDADGVADLKTVDFLVTPTGAGANSIWARYNRVTNKLFLYNDAGTALLRGSCTPGVIGYIQNKQGKVNCGGTTVTKTGDRLTVKWVIIPDPAFSAPTAKQLKLKAVDNANATSGWKVKGSWTINP